MKKLTLILLLLITSCDLKSSKEYLKEAWALEDKQQYTAAIKLLNKAIDKDSKFKEAYLSRGADKAVLKDYKGAISDYNNALKIDPKNTLALFNLGNNYKRLNENAEAIIYYNKAFESKGGDMAFIDLAPNGVTNESNFDVPGQEIFYQRAFAYLGIDSLKKSFNDFHKCVNFGYKIVDSYYWMGAIAKAYKNKDVACKCFLKSAQLGNSNAALEQKSYCDQNH